MKRQYLLKRQYFNIGTSGFYGAYYVNPHGSDCAVILMIGEKRDDYLITSCVRWLHRRGCNVMAMAPREQANGIHNYPLERIGSAITWLKRNGNRKVGMMGGSATATIALAAAAHYPEITFTLAISPSDFIFEGFLRDKKDGAWERPADGEALVSWRGKALPYVPYAYRHPDYCRKLKAEAQLGGNLVASRDMFRESERLHPVTEAETIPVEKIRGTLILAGAEDDCLWDACKYIRRIMARLKEKQGKCTCRAFLYDHGTHFLAPQSLLYWLMPLSANLVVLPYQAGRQNLLDCRAARLDLDEKVGQEIRGWVLS